MPAEKKISVLFVCLGNICRSPTAEAVLKKLVLELANQNKFHIESAGTAGYHVGERPDSRTRRYGEKRGLHFNSLAQKFNSKTHFETFDYILCMDENNFKDIVSLDKENKYSNKIFQIMNFAPASGYKIVPDPYYGDAKDFELVIDLSEQACLGFLNFL